MAQHIELAVFVFDFQGNGGLGCFCRAAANFRILELNTVGYGDGGAVRAAAMGRNDRRLGRLDNAGHGYFRHSCLDINRERNGLEQWFMHGGRHGMEDPPMGCLLVGIAVIEDRGQGGPLRPIRAFVDDGLNGAVAFKNRPRPGIHNDEV